MMKVYEYCVRISRICPADGLGAQQPIIARNSGSLGRLMDNSRFYRVRVLVLLKGAYFSSATALSHPVWPEGPQAPPQSGILLLSVRTRHRADTDITTYPLVHGGFDVQVAVEHPASEGCNSFTSSQRWGWTVDARNTCPTCSRTFAARLIFSFKLPRLSHNLHP